MIKLKLESTFPSQAPPPPPSYHTYSDGYTFLMTSLICGSRSECIRHHPPIPSMKYTRSDDRSTW